MTTSFFKYSYFSFWMMEVPVSFDLKKIDLTMIDICLNKLIYCFLKIIILNFQLE